MDLTGRLRRPCQGPLATDPLIVAQPARTRSALRTASATARWVHDYLQEELADRLDAGPFSSALQVELTAGFDPSVAWPEERQMITIGRLPVAATADDRQHDGDVLVFDPTRITSRIELSDDSLLRFRPQAYAEAVQRRTEG